MNYTRRMCIIQTKYPVIFRFVNLVKRAVRLSRSGPPTPFLGTVQVSTLVTILLFGCAIGIVFALIMISLNKITQRVFEQYGVKLKDANFIVNQGRPPESWVEPYRRQLAETSSGHDASTRIGERAKRLCLKRLKFLLRFMEKGKFYDNERTRVTVVKSLKREYERWTAADGVQLILEEGEEVSEE